MQSLSQRELEGMRDTLSAVRSTSAEIWRRTAVNDPGGGQTDTWTKVHDYKVLYYSSSGSERQRPDVLIVTISEFNFVFQDDADINQADHIVIGVRTFNVESVGGRSDEISVGLLVSARELS